MSTLVEYIKAQPDRTMGQWASALGVSRPYLYGLIDGTRTPRLRVALQIEAATGGQVPISAWPNLRAVIDAAQNPGAAGNPRTSLLVNYPGAAASGAFSDGDK